MNILTVLLLTSCVFGVTVSGFSSIFDTCCSYPIQNSVQYTNVSSSEFSCSESIHLACVKKDNYVATAFIYNYTKGDKHIATGLEGERVDLDIACDPSTKLWQNKNPDGSKRYKSYGCSYKTEHGVWVIE